MARKNQVRVSVTASLKPLAKKTSRKLKGRGSNKGSRKSASKLAEATQAAVPASEYDFNGPMVSKTVLISTGPCRPICQVGKWLVSVTFLGLVFTIAARLSFIFTEGQCEGLVPPATAPAMVKLKPTFH
jgi:hypothetical protein